MIFNHIYIAVVNYLFSYVDSEKERKCGPDGFIDSTRYRHNYVSKKDRRAAREQEKVAKLSAVDMALKTEKTKSDFIKRQKVIEVGYKILIESILQQRRLSDK